MATCTLPVPCASLGGVEEHRRWRKVRASLHEHVTLPDTLFKLTLRCSQRTL
jgi:hypothetical protein